MLKRSAPPALVRAAEKAYGKWPKCKCGYPCEVRRSYTFHTTEAGAKTMRTMLGCVASDCDTGIPVIWMED